MELESPAKAIWVSDVAGMIVKELYDGQSLLALDDPMASLDFLKTFKWLSGTEVMKRELEKLPFKPADSGVKSAKVSSAQRSLGAEKLEKRELNAALKCLNQSVIFAPVESDENIHNSLPTLLSSAYNSRSKLLYEMKKYTHSISDVLHAMKYGCANAEIADLFQRQGCCCEQLGEFGKAIRCYQEAISMCKESHIDDTCVKRLVSLQRKVSSCPGNERKSLLRVNANPLQWKPTPSLEDYSHPEFPSVSNALSIDLSTSQDKATFVAARNIDTGELIISEKPFVWVGYELELLDRCGGCTRKCEVVQPCRGCSAVVYCSQDCEQEWYGCDSLECTVMPYLKSIPGYDVQQHGHHINASLVLRALGQCIVNVSLCKWKRSAASTSADAHMFKIHSGHIKDTGHHSLSSMMLSTVSAALLLKLLKLTGAIEKCFPNITAEQSGGEHFRRELCLVSLDNLHRLFPGASALRSVSTLAMENESTDDLLGAILTCFFVGFPESDRDVHVVRFANAAGVVPRSYCAARLNAVGCAFYPSLTMFDKSCYPHAVAVNHGAHIAVRIVRHVRHGERVTVGHDGISFDLHDYAMRCKCLSAAAEACTCEVCVRRLSASDQVQMPTLACRRCGAAIRSVALRKCPGCRRPVKTERAALDFDWMNALERALSMTSKLPLEAPDLAESILKIVRPIDRRMAEPFMTVGHSTLATVLHMVFCADGNVEQ